MIAIPTFPTFLKFPRGGAQQELSRIERPRERAGRDKNVLLMPQVAAGGVQGTR